MTLPRGFFVLVRFVCAGRLLLISCVKSSRFVINLETGYLLRSPCLDLRDHRHEKEDPIVAVSVNFNLNPRSSVTTRSYSFYHDSYYARCIAQSASFSFPAIPAVFATACVSVAGYLF
ncbi:hypothetical protein DFH08DRAFT_418347 [Mycena albidolilacea]|uniref:Secreted protein n=1 Tax=Mycena albidolilacea TaxID=1033008 RepID=A0AAD7AJ27_9AGAR|nr:hypothetical protein DFH08DRAFT_418347 [Mycena albidolilacea]